MLVARLGLGMDTMMGVKVVVVVRGGGNGSEVGLVVLLSVAELVMVDCKSILVSRSSDNNNVIIK